MNFRYLMLGAAILAVTGAAGVNAADKKAPTQAEQPAWNSMRDGAPPPAQSGKQIPLSEEEMYRAADEDHDEAEMQRRASRSEEQIINEASDEVIDAVAEHNKQMYGSEHGLNDALAAQEKKAAEAKKKVSMYGMTYEERAALAEQDAKAKDTRPMVYEPKKKTTQPPRLFNNVTTPAGQ